MTPMPNHPNRSKTNRARWSTPTPAEIKAAREIVGLTMEQAAGKVYAPMRTWQNWENQDPAENRRMHPAIFELFLLKTGQLAVDEILKPPG